MNLKEIEAIENVLVRSAFLKAWHFAENTVGEYGCDCHNKLYNEESYTISVPQAEKQAKGVQSELRQAIREIDDWETVWNACLDEWE